MPAAAAMEVEEEPKFIVPYADYCSVVEQNTELRCAIGYRTVEIRTCCTPHTGSCFS